MKCQSSFLTNFPPISLLLTKCIPPLGEKWEKFDKQPTIASHVADQYTETGANGNQNALSLFEYKLPGLVPTQNPIERHWLEIKGGGQVSSMIVIGRPFNECLTEEMPRLVREAGIRCRGMVRTFPMLHKGEACVTRELAMNAHRYFGTTQDPESGEAVENYIRSPTDPRRWYFNSLSMVKKEKSKPISEGRISARNAAVNEGAWTTEPGKEATAVADCISLCNDLHCVSKVTCPFGDHSEFYSCDCEEHQVKGACPHSVVIAFPEKVKKMKKQVILIGTGYEKPKYNRKKKLTASKKGESSNKRVRKS